MMGLVGGRPVENRDKNKGRLDGEGGARHLSRVRQDLKPDSQGGVSRQAMSLHLANEAIPKRFGHCLGFRMHF